MSISAFVELIIYPLFRIAFMKSKIIIGTRGSKLALWQANFTKDKLATHGVEAEITIIKTVGDTSQQWNTSFEKLEGKGFFTKELEEALLSGDIDLAVHSCKDLPTENPIGLTIAAYSYRANPFDCLLIRKEESDEAMPLKLKKNAIVGTSSSRRKCQLMAFRPDIILKDIRGNVPTRIEKLKQGEFDAIMLAKAGIERLEIDISEFEVAELRSPMFIPAAAQGVLAYQIRENDNALHEVCKLLSNAPSAEITRIERTFLNGFQGGCQIPLGIFAEKENDNTHIWISYAKGNLELPLRKHILQTAGNSINYSQLIQSMKTPERKSVYITSDITSSDYFYRVLTANCQIVNSGSFMVFSAVDFVFDQADWLFFSSKNGVKFFFDQVKELPTTTKIAAINQGTAQEILNLNYPVYFTGTGSSITHIAEQFDSLASGKIVFPQAENSLQSIQKLLKNNTQSETLIVYKNQPKAKIEQRNEDVLVFTSPFNAQTYFEQHILQEKQTVVSIGNSTTKKLNELGISAVRTAYQPTPWSLVDEVF